MSSKFGYRLIQRLRLANRLAWAASGRLRSFLVDAIVIVSALGMLIGIALDPVLSWLGHPAVDRVPLWFTVLCGVVSLSILGGQWIAERERERASAE